MIEVGSKVRFINETLWMRNPGCYPQPGMIGVVEQVIRDLTREVRWYAVKWPIGLWCAAAEDLEEVEAVGKEGLTSEQ